MVAELRMEVTPGLGPVKSEVCSVGWVVCRRTRRWRKHILLGQGFALKRNWVDRVVWTLAGKVSVYGAMTMGVIRVSSEEWKPSEKCGVGMMRGSNERRTGDRSDGRADVLNL